MPELVATIGFFDGVHRGHRFLIDRVIEEAQRSGMSSAVITFDRHPREVLQTDYQPDLLLTLDEKLLLLSKTHVDNTVVLHFDASLAALTAHDFYARRPTRRVKGKKTHHRVRQSFRTQAFGRFLTTMCAMVRS